ncbi:MAG: AIPR family protein [Bacteroidetes bacterium]|nr:AIPR family protein [Bacteroidota bacterium]
MDIREQIVDDQIEKLNINLGLNDVNKAFQIFGHSLFTDNSVYSYDPNDDVDGGQDKQIDNITIEQKDGEGIIYITQAKNEDSFSSNSLIQIRNGLNWIFNKKKADVDTLTNTNFKDKIKDCKNLVALIGPSNIEVRVAYITNALSTNVSNECAQELHTIVEQFDNDTYSKFTFEMIGAIEIVDRLNAQEKKNKKINADIKIKYDANSPSLIKYHSHGLKGIICTTTAKEVARIVNEDEKGFVFDLNVRKYLGNLGTVNKDIKETCSDEDSSHLFWFLNNGVTIVCDKVDPVTDPDNPHMKIENFQIVNGCQTSSSLAIAEKENLLQENTNVILKIFETSDLNLVDKIVLTTNNQNKITNRNLRANDKIQRDLERAFLIHDYYYERKPRQFQDVDSQKIIPNELAATAFLAIALKRPSDARSRKYKVWSDYYESIFKSTHVETFIVNHLIKHKVSKFINNSKLVTCENEIKRYIAKNGQFHIARMTSFIWRKTDNWTDVELLKKQLAEIESSPDSFDDNIQQAFDAIIELLNANKGLHVDLNNTLKSSSFDSLMSAELHKKYSV